MLLKIIRKVKKAALHKSKGGEQVKFFDYDKNASNVEYYEILEDLMERWEHEIVELKKAKADMMQIKLDVIFEISSMIGLYLA